jgi:hypothetical protein
MPNETITIEEMPVVSAFTYMRSDGSFYCVFAEKREDHYELIFQLEKEILGKERISWNIPPDYIAAKELLDLFLKRLKK